MKALYSYEKLGSTNPVTKCHIPSILQDKGTTFFHASGNTNSVTEHHIPADLDPPQKCCRNLKSYIVYLRFFSFMNTHDLEDCSYQND
jgi:hypothetical protein